MVDPKRDEIEIRIKSGTERIIRYPVSRYGKRKER